jgi:hypothetical protein
VPGPLGFVILVALPLWCVAPAGAAEYTLQVASLRQDAFRYFIRGAVGSGAGELAMPRLEQALDAGTVGAGVLLYDRNLEPAPRGIATAFAAMPVAPSAQWASGPGQWQSVRWHGGPGQRAVWMLRPASTHDQQVSDLALSSPDGELRYHIPYRVTLFPKPARAVAFPLPFLRFHANSGSLWSRHLSRAVDLRDGLAAVVGVNTTAGDWVHLVIEPPPTPTPFKAVIGWRRRGASDEVIAGTGTTRIR